MIFAIIYLTVGFIVMAVIFKRDGVDNQLITLALDGFESAFAAGLVLMTVLSGVIIAWPLLTIAIIIEAIIMSRKE